MKAVLCPNHDGTYRIFPQQWENIKPDAVFVDISIGRTLSVIKNQDGSFSILDVLGDRFPLDFAKRNNHDILVVSEDYNHVVLRLPCRNWIPDNAKAFDDFSELQHAWKAAVLSDLSAPKAKPKGKKNAKGRGRA